MKNIPDKIYLQHGIEDQLTGYDFSELIGVTWAEDQKNKNDLEYFSKDELIKAIIHGHRYALAGTSREKTIKLYETTH